MNTEREIVIMIVLDSWRNAVKRVDSLLKQLSDVELHQEVVLGKERGVYILGILTATNDKLFHTLNICSMIFPDYENLFLETHDSPLLDLPSAEEVKKRWINVNVQLDKAFQEIHPNEWFRRHALISDAEFEIEPHRNKLNVMISQTNNLNFYLGQLVLLKDRVKRPEY